MRFLITGATGQVGSALHMRLLASQHECLALSHAQLDICNTSAVLEKIHIYQPDIIINAAAYTAVDKAELDAENAYQVNVEGVTNLAKAAAQIDAAIFHLSTDYVFSGTNKQGYKEEDAAHPLTIYGKSKLAGEEALAAITPKHLILRTSWAFSEHSNNFINKLLALGHTHSRLDMVTDQWGSPTYSGDISTTLLTMINRYFETNRINWGLYHYAGSPSISRFELATYVYEQAIRQGIYKQAPRLNPVRSTEYPSTAKRPESSILDCTKIYREFGITPSKWQQALTNLLKYDQSKPPHEAPQ